MPTIAIAPSAGFLPLRALTPCKLHDASQKLEPDNGSSRRSCLCSGSTEVPEGCEGCWQPHQSPDVPSSCRNVCGWAAAAGWGWGCVLNPMGLKQPPEMRGPQTPDLDLCTCCLSLFSALFYQKSQDGGSSQRLGLEAQAWWHCMGILPQMVLACGQPMFHCFFSQGVLFSDFISNMWDYPGNRKVEQTRFFPWD